MFTAREIHEAFGLDLSDLESERMSDEHWENMPVKERARWYAAHLLVLMTALRLNPSLATVDAAYDFVFSAGGVEWADLHQRAQDGLALEFLDRLSAKSQQTDSMSRYLVIHDQGPGGTMAHLYNVGVFEAQCESEADAMARRAWRLSEGHSVIVRALDEIRDGWSHYV